MKLLFILLLTGIGVKAQMRVILGNDDSRNVSPQPKYDTLPVVLLCTDEELKLFTVWNTLDSNWSTAIVPASWAYFGRTHSKTFSPSFSMKGYEVKTKEMVDLPEGAQIIMDTVNSHIGYIKDGKRVWRQLAKHVRYLDEKKKPLPKNIIVWQVK